LHIGEDDFDTEDALGEAEPWEDWETKLVSFSIGIGVLVLLIAGTIINMTILNK
jgi:hypothetical protein